MEPVPGLIALVDRDVELAAREVRLPGRVERLTENEARLLSWLVAREGRVVSAEELLVEVWGYRPGVRSRTVITTVGRLRGKLEADPTRPRHLLTEGSGYLWRGATTEGGPPTRGNLPEELDAFVGRVGALEQIREALGAGARLLTLLGGPGVGKTRLALRFAATRGGGWRGGVWLLDLAVGRSEEPDLGRKLVETLGFAPMRLDELCSALQARGEALLILDNVERDVVALRPWLAPLLRAGATLLITSREPVGVPEERVFEVDPLSLPESVELLLARARRRLTVERPLLDALVEGLDGLPLAIELAAGRLDLLSPEELVARLPRRLRVLKDPGRDPRHATLLDAIGASWAMLEARHQEALMALSVLEGSFDLCALEVVAPGGVDESLDAAEHLRARGLLRGELVQGQRRWRLLASVRDFARERLRASGGEAGALARLRRWAASYAEARYRLLETEQAPGARAGLSLEADNLVAAADSDLASPEAAIIARALAVRARQAWDGRVASLLERIPLPQDAELAVPLLLAREEACAQSGREGSALLDQAVVVARGAGEERLLAQVLCRSGIRLRDRGALDEAERALNEAATAADRARAPLEQGTCAVERARLLRRRGELDRAVELLEPQVGALSRGGYARMYVVAASTLASLLAGLGRGDEAERQLRRLLDAPGLQGDQENLAAIYLNIANRCVLDGRYDEAERLDRKALAIHRERGGRRGEAFVLGNLGFVEMGRQRLQEAERSFLAAAAIHAELAHNLGQAQMLGAAARVRHAQGDARTARVRYLEAEGRLRGCGVGERTAELAALRVLATRDAEGAERAHEEWAVLRPELILNGRRERLVTFVERWLDLDDAGRAAARRELGTPEFDRKSL